MAVKRVLLTGMPGTGKSSVIGELAALGYKAIDTDDGWCEPKDWRPGPATCAPPLYRQGLAQPVPDRMFCAVPGYLAVPTGGTAALPWTHDRMG